MNMDANVLCSINKVSYNYILRHANFLKYGVKS